MWWVAAVFAITAEWQEYNDYREDVYLFMQTHPPTVQEALDMAVGLRRLYSIARHEHDFGKREAVLGCSIYAELMDHLHPHVDAETERVRPLLEEALLEYADLHAGAVEDGDHHAITAYSYQINRLQNCISRLDTWIDDPVDMIGRINNAIYYLNHDPMETF